MTIDVTGTSWTFEFLLSEVCGATKKTPLDIMLAYLV